MANSSSGVSGVFAKREGPPTEMGDGVDGGVLVDRGRSRKMSKPREFPPTKSDQRLL